MIGKTITHYKIVEKLGEGGMGVVYKARDSKLDRFIALKFLPPSFEIKDEDKARFLREAKAAAAINHPNVCTIHDIQEHEGQKFIIMEYIEGETLREMIYEGQVTNDKAIEYALQIGEALKAAHEKGIVHRDIKSDNIMITDTGQVKVMDFGLAKLRGSAKLTQHSSIIGTLAYMSPEQISSKPVDARSDIFSFGIVLYEMLAGQRPFRGEYDSAIMYSILNEEPIHLQESLPSVSSELLHIIDRVLEKDPEDRYQTVKDMVIELRRLKRNSEKVSGKYIQVTTDILPDSGTSGEGKKRERNYLINKKTIMVMIAIFLLSIVIFIYFSLEKDAEILPARHSQVTFTGKAFQPQISPDGAFVAYISRGDSIVDRLIVQDLGGGKSLEIYREKEILSFSWLPDGTELSVQVQLSDFDYKEFLVPRLGGAVRKIKDDSPGLHWSPDGSKFAWAWPGYKRILITEKIAGDTSSIDIAGDYSRLNVFDWSPSGDHLLLKTKSQNEYVMWTIRIDGSKQQKLFSDSVYIFSPRWSHKGEAIYFLRSSGRANDLLKLELDPTTCDLVEMPKVIQSGLQTGYNISISRDNRNLLYTRVTENSNLKLLKKNKSSYKIFDITTGTAQVFTPSLSPDGANIAFSMGNNQECNIFVASIDGGIPRQLTFLNSSNYSPAWSPDGKEIAFGSNQNGKSRVWKVSSSGGHPSQFVSTELDKDHWEIFWAPYDEILYLRPGLKNFHFLGPKSGEERPLTEIEKRGMMLSPKYSPNMDKIALYWNRYRKVRIKDKSDNISGLWVISLLDSSKNWLSPGKTYFPICWSTDGRWIFANSKYDRPGEILRINTIDGREQHYFTLPYNEPQYVMMTQDQKIILFVEVDRQSDIWMMENFDPEVE